MNASQPRNYGGSDWLLVNASVAGGLTQPTAHWPDWLPPNGATSTNGTDEHVLTSVNREAITRCSKNVMRYYAVTAVPFNEVRRELSERELLVDVSCRQDQSGEFYTLLYACLSHRMFISIVISLIIIITLLYTEANK